MDAITSAVVGRYFEVGDYEPMGIPSEAQLVVPKVRPLRYDQDPVICLAGKTGAGKSVVARYLSVFFGFEWIKTRDIIADLLLVDRTLPRDKRLWDRGYESTTVSEKDLRDFGAVVLTLHKQVPLRRALATQIEKLRRPIVVDSIRDMVDIARELRNGRPIVTWFIDCSDSVIEQRLTAHTKLGQKRAVTATAVDHKAIFIRGEADAIIKNDQSLEELRWKVDDTLFSILSIQADKSYI
jgi:dephospho-CoA kinase